MHALKGVKINVSDKHNSRPLKNADTYDVLKKQRRQEIVAILKGNDKGLTITDIKITAKGRPLEFKSILSCGEKTLQRELISMLKDHVLEKDGEKRWSRYFVKG